MTALASVVIAAALDPVFLVAGMSIFTVAIYGGLLSTISQEGGRIRARTYELPELLLSLVLAGFFVALMVKTILNPAGEEAAAAVTLEHVLPNAVFFVVMTASIIGFLAFRGIDFRVALGLMRIPIVRAIALGFGLLLAALPLVMLAAQITQLVLKNAAQEQELVKLFKEVAQQSNRAGVWQIVVAGAVVAPICEEFLFRGFFYPVFKRYLGGVASALLMSALFAAFHMNLMALPTLFVLALCLTIAFEVTGSLVVPITMHAIFNGAQLAILYFSAHLPAPA